MAICVYLLLIKGTIWSVGVYIHLQSVHVCLPLDRYTYIKVGNKQPSHDMGKMWKERFSLHPPLNVRQNCYGRTTSYVRPLWTFWCMKIMFAIRYQRLYCDPGFTIFIHVCQSNLTIITDMYFQVYYDFPL